MKSTKLFISLAVCLSLSAGSMASVEGVGSLKHNTSGTRGDVSPGQIKIQNSEDKPQEVRVYQTDLLYNYEGFTEYSEEESHSRSNRSWIQFSPQSLILQPHEVRFIQYEITVPESDSICGTFWSILMVEGVNPKNPEQSGELNIETITRYAIQMVTEITDPGEGQLQFYQPTLIREGDKLYLAVDLLNTGDHYISPEVSMELYDESGQTVQKITASKKGLFPTTSTRFKLDLAGLKADQTYQCLIVAVGEDEDVFGLEYTLYF